MEDTNLLLMKVLKIHYRDRLQILDEALKVIKEYSGKTASSQSEYDITSLTLRSMLNDLPQDILKYFLTMVPLPKNKENLEMNRDDNSNIRDILQNYLKSESAGPGLDPKRKPGNAAPKDPAKPKVGTPAGRPATAKKPIQRRRRPANQNPNECKKLLDICAEYLVTNRKSLGDDLASLKNKLWAKLNSHDNCSATLQRLYGEIRDVNKKMKWLRLLDAEDVSTELIRDEFGRSEVFLKEKHLEDSLTEDPFEISDQLKKAIAQFVHN